MSRCVGGIAAVCILLGAFQATAGGFDDELDDELRGAWAILEHEVYSSCSGTYSDNQVGAAGVSSKADRRFDAGELVKIDKIKTWKRGFSDGQRIVFHTRLARELTGCYVPVPGPPLS